MEEVLSVEDYIDHEMKRLDKLIEVKKKKLEHKFNKVPNTNGNNSFNIRQNDKETHIERMVLNFSQVEIPKDYSDLLSKELDYKVPEKRLPLLDIVSAAEDTTENISNIYEK